ncbi:DUF3040 domain-containing protein [Streptomyces sp. NPDC001123]
MESRNDPDGVVLSPHERLALWGIEAGLLQDRRLVRRMRHRDPRPAWLPMSVGVLTCASLLLLVIAILTSDVAALWCLAALWPVTVLLAFRMLRCAADSDDHSRTWR